MPLIFVQRFVAFLGMMLLTALFAARAETIPDALSVEWQGHKLCEKLFEDGYIRMARCTFPPGTIHLCHSHPSYISYVLSGGEARVTDEKGTWEGEVRAGTFVDSAPVRWHEIVNTGNTTLEFLLIEKKYEPALALSETACPGRRPG